MLAPGTGTRHVYAISAADRRDALASRATRGRHVDGGDRRRARVRRRRGGKFTAYDEKTGDVLWQANVGSPISGYPVGYAVDGKQYVAVSTGSSGVYNNGRRFAPEFVPEKTDPAVFVFALP